MMWGERPGKTNRPPFDWAGPLSFAVLRFFLEELEEWQYRHLAARMGQVRGQM